MMVRPAEAKGIQAILTCRVSSNQPVTQDTEKKEEEKGGSLERGEMAQRFRAPAALGKDLTVIPWNSSHALATQVLEHTTPSSGLGEKLNTHIAYAHTQRYISKYFKFKNIRAKARHSGMCL